MNVRIDRCLLALGTGALLALAACNSKSDTPLVGGSDEIDTRMAVDRRGLPVAGARIALVRSGDSTNKPVALSATAKDGTFPTFVVPDGYYAVVVRDPGDSLGKFTDSVHVVNQTLPSGRDTLLALGSIRGMVRVATGHSPATVTITLLGTDILANVKNDGTFLVDLVPGSLYTLAAIPSLEGYGTLYKRIQLKDGQNLSIPDTLVMPFQALPAPGSLKVEQDSETGDVHLVWNRVVNPDLLDYTVERMEHGSVISVSHLTDTAWTDSLYSSWEGTDFDGPWLPRDVVYRVCSRSIGGNPDSRRIAQSLAASPPSWTRHLEPLKVTMTTDSVTRTTTLKWNTPAYPDITGWKVVRSINGVKDCVSDSVSSGWTDVKCGDQSHRVLQFAGSDSLIDRTAWTASYSVQFDRRQRVTYEANTDTVARETHPKNPLVVWRDSIAFTDKDIVSFSQVGDWISQNALDGCAHVSKDGVHWIDPPLRALQVAGQGDSIWFGRMADNSHYALCHRTGDNTWIWDTIYVSTEVVATQLGAVNGWPILTNFDQTKAWRLKPFLAQGIDLPGIRQIVAAQPREEAKGASVFPIDSMSRVEIGTNYWNEISWDLVQGESVLARRYSTWGRTRSLVGVFRTPAILFQSTVEIDKGFVGAQHLVDKREVIGVQGLTGNSWILPSPTNKSLASSPQLTVFHDEIWTVLDGRLWKGKVDLPL